jgi:hypothetical protein
VTTNIRRLRRLGAMAWPTLAAAAVGLCTAVVMFIPAASQQSRSLRLRLVKSAGGSGRAAPTCAGAPLQQPAGLVKLRLRLPCDGLSIGAVNRT